MAIPTVYRSTDPGAPQMQYNVAGSALAVIRACLVNGYGAKPGAGWTEPFTGATVAAFRNASGRYVHVDDSSAGSGGAPIALTGYADMTAVSTGTKPSSTRYSYRRVSNTNHNPAWVLVADDDTFYINVWAPDSSNSNYTSLAGGGRIRSYQAGDAFDYGVWGGAGVSYAFSSFIAVSNQGLGSTVDGGISLGSDHTGLAGATAYCAVLGIAGGNSVMGCSAYPPRPSLNAADEACVRFLLGSGQVIRGEMRGLYVPLSDLIALSPGDARSGGGLAGAGSEFIALRQGNRTAAGPAPNAGCWVETALDWGA